MDENNWTAVVMLRVNDIELQFFFRILFQFLALVFVLLVELVVLSRFGKYSKACIRERDKNFRKLPIVDRIGHLSLGLVVLIEVKGSHADLLFFHQIRVVLVEPLDPAVAIED